MTTPVFVVGPLVTPWVYPYAEKDEIFYGSTPFYNTTFDFVPGVSATGTFTQYELMDTGFPFEGDAWLAEVYADVGADSFVDIQAVLDGSAELDTRGIPSILSGAPVFLCFYGNTGNDTVIGSTNEDVIYGGAGNDVIDASLGNDFVDAGLGDDSVFGNNGYDVIFGGEGYDTLEGGIGDDSIDGGSEDDLISGGLGNDDIIGGSGEDYIEGGMGDDAIDAGTGDDYVEGGEGFDNIIAGEGADTVYAGRQGDVVDAGDGADVVFGQAGWDAIALGEGGDRGVGGRGFDLILGEGGDDRLFGNAGNDTLDGGAGNDSLYGGIGRDVLIDGAGDDRLFGRGGADDIWITTGNDIAVGGGGADTFIFSDNTHGEAFVPFTNLGVNIIRDFNVLENDQIDLKCVFGLDFLDVVRFDADTAILNGYTDSNMDGMYTADDVQILQIQVFGANVGDIFEDDTAYTSASGLASVYVNEWVGIDLPTNDDSEDPGMIFV